ncbi:MAG: 2-C-methyl-D-erythritol 4-phosphate cytidylyltransferase [Lachnospiraceae bacterium]|nr:2-C-methyl-D-erythritol 4-phosphate cytidylyltransferase [Lachnospiraceae bacterium]
MNIALILSGGTGSRVGGDIPKQYMRAGGKMMITYTLRAVASCSKVNGIQIVCSEDHREEILKDIESDTGLCELVRGFSEPGENRQLSALNGMRDIMKYAGEDDVVIIHDAARPFVKAGTISDIIDACDLHDGAMPVLPMKDTVYISEDGRSVSSLIDRSRLFAGQAPEAFLLGKYISATEALLPDDIFSVNGASEPAVMAGMDIVFVKGDEDNFKITTAADLERFRSVYE